MTVRDKRSGLDRDRLFFGHKRHQYCGQERMERQTKRMLRGPSNYRNRVRQLHRLNRRRDRQPVKALSALSDVVGMTGRDGRKHDARQRLAVCTEESHLGSPRKHTAPVAACCSARGQVGKKWPGVQGRSLPAQRVVPGCGKP